MTETAPELRKNSARDLRRPSAQAALAIAAAWLCLGSSLARCHALQASEGKVAEAVPAGDPKPWIEAAMRNEVGIIQAQGTFSVRYHERKIDARGDTTRVVIESQQGAVARLIERNGVPISAAQDQAERSRLQEAIDHPDDFLRHHRHDQEGRNNAVQMVKLMPAAMVYTYTPGQPQPAGAQTAQVVLDYRPDPNFHPPTMLAEVLTGLQGRVWIDATTQRVTRIESKVLKPVNFGYGMVARLYPGGTLEFEQASVGDGHWIYSHVDEHLTVRAMMVKTVPENQEIRSSQIEPLPKLLGYQDAIRMLLAMPVATR